ncbi:MAG: O-antigen ligase C-terminal domain-containing protein [Vitreoscilla sp.]|nr:O-antigen ligase C-terminal domain-containing protein [Vitreoscilla sp.]
MSTAHPAQTTPAAIAIAFALVAPTLLAFNVSPSATLLNQLLAVAGWGAVLASGVQAHRAAARSGWVLAAVLGLLAAAALWSGRVGLPASMVLSALALCGCTWAVTHHALAGDSAFGDFAAAMLVAGLASVGVAVVQVFLPEWADGTLIARSGLPGRAVGNLRQPNHLSSLLLWALIALVPLAQARRLWQARLSNAAAAGCAVLLVLGVVLSASRTGVIGVLMLAAWGLLDRRLAGRVRIGLLATPVVYLLLWFAAAAWAHHAQQAFGGEARLAESDLSASRFGIWANALALIRANPWFGVGFGEFNFAWTLTPFPGRPTAFFDHTHNLPLHLAVELGLPLATLVLGLLLWGLWQAFRRAWAQPADEGAGARAAFLMVLMIGVHSLLEYPLWYAYFLLPTAWAWGFALRASPATGPSHRPAAWLRGAGALMLAGALFALVDYWKVVVIYAPSADAAPLAQRIERGQRSLFFGYQADYAAATTTEPPSAAMGAFASTTHSLLDTRLMMAWAQALDESGHADRASYLAARLREFRNPATKEFFATCDEADDTAPLPFQCEAPPANLGWRDFLPGSE